MNKGNGKPDYQAIDIEIAARTDIHALAQELGVEFAASAPNSEGWLSCHAIGRRDENPSAAINVSGEGWIRGRYTDKGAEEKGSLNDWVAMCRQTDWRESRAWLARRAGLSLHSLSNSKGRPHCNGSPHRNGKRKRDVLAVYRRQCVEIKRAAPREEAFKRFIQNRCKTTAEVLHAASAKAVQWVGEYLCVALPFYSEHDQNKPCAIVLLRADGKPFPPHGNLGARRHHCLAGSCDGWLIVGRNADGDWERGTKTAEIDGLVLILRVEGPSDLLGLAPFLRPGHVAISNAFGAVEAQNVSAGFLGGRPAVTIGDADKAGEKGSQGFARKHGARIAKLPYSLEEKHGKDLRDFLMDNPGNEWRAVQKLIDAAEPIEADLEESEELDYRDALKPEAQTDIANGKRFAELHGGRARFAFEWGKWLCHDGIAWKLDASEVLVSGLAKDVSEQIWRDSKVASKNEAEIVSGVARHASTSHSITAMLRLSRSEPGICVGLDELDVHPLLFNCLNGTLDLETGRLREHKPSDLLTQDCKIAYDVNAQCPTWERFLSSLFSAEADQIIGFLQRYFGYAITGLTTEQQFLIPFGGGSNGKTTMVEGICDAMGPSYAMTAPPRLLMARRSESHPTELAGLFRKRLVICQETEEGQRLNESLVKRLTGGDRISARRMREDFWSFDPTHKLVLCTNHKPRIHGSDHAIWRRVVLVPFTQRFWNPDRGEAGPDELKQDKSLPKRLKAESPGILSWLVRGTQEWLRSGLQVPDCLNSATSQYRDEEDILKLFLDDCTEAPAVETSGLKASSAFAAYRIWCTQEGVSPVTQRTFGRAMTERGPERGFERHRSDGYRYKGLTLNDEWNQKLDEWARQQAAREASRDGTESASTESHEQFVAGTLEPSGT